MCMSDACPTYIVQDPLPHFWTFRNNDIWFRFCHSIFCPRAFLKQYTSMALLQVKIPFRGTRNEPRAFHLTLFISCSIAASYKEVISI